ncbi:hypothetical protein D3C85_1649740 [compost metagenome]
MKLSSTLVTAVPAATFSSRLTTASAMAGALSLRLLTLTVTCAVSDRLPSLAVTVSTCWLAVS